MWRTHLEQAQLVPLVALILAFFLNGCMESRADPGLSREDERLAKRVILRHQCGNCHTLQAAGLRLVGEVGPDLSHQGRRARTAEWLAGHLLNPISIPDSEVAPGFEGKQRFMPKLHRVSGRELDALVAFLRSLE